MALALAAWADKPSDMPPGHTHQGHRPAGPRENPWFLNMEDKLETGKLADLAVLNDDYLKVSDEGLKRIGSVLTLVNGNVVYDAGVVPFDRD